MTSEIVPPKQTTLEESLRLQKGLAYCGCLIEALKLQKPPSAPRAHAEDSRTLPNAHLGSRAPDKGSPSVSWGPMEPHSPTAAAMARCLLATARPCRLALLQEIPLLHCSCHDCSAKSSIQ